MTHLNLELTTRCNMACDFCNRTKLISERKRPSMDMDLEHVKRVLDHFAGPDITFFTPVGLGEPLLYPSLLQVIKYARQCFPKAKITLNTNGSLPMEQLIEQIDYLTISLCYPTELLHDYHTKTKTFDRIRANIERFLEEKGDREPITAIHIFKRPLNVVISPWFFMRFYYLLGTKDYLKFYPYLPLTKMQCPKEPQEGIVMVDVHGNKFNSCMGVWFTENDHLNIGWIS